jgi:hypothetical protein
MAKQQKRQNPNYLMYGGIGIIVVIVLVLILTHVFRKPNWTDSQKTGFYQYLQTTSAGKLSQDCLNCAVSFCSSKYTYQHAVNPKNFADISKYISTVCPSCVGPQSNWNDSQKTGFYQYLQTTSAGALSQDCLHCAVSFCSSKYTFVDAIDPKNLRRVAKYIAKVCPSCNTNVKQSSCYQPFNGVGSESANKYCVKVGQTSGSTCPQGQLTDVNCGQKPGYYKHIPA